MPIHDPEFAATGSAGGLIRRNARWTIEMKKSSAIALALLLAAGVAQAHGDAGHADRAHKAAAPAAKEQKPWGIAGDARNARRTIVIEMGDDMRFTPDRIEVRQGETVRFEVRNKGGMLHEMVLGTKEELDAHAALMRKFPHMEHDEPYMAHVRPAAAGELVWNFSRPGEFEYACLVDGHYQAGMKGRISVTAGGSRKTPTKSAP
jgi:uncharacterized cupredoxin-like copper-binding protein